jgi:hypothetical protein
LDTIDLDTIDHFFVMVGQLLDNAKIGGVLVRLTLSDGRVVEGVPDAATLDLPLGAELYDSGYARWIGLAGSSVDLSDVRDVTIVRPPLAG